MLIPPHGLKELTAENRTVKTARFFRGKESDMDNFKFIYKILRTLEAAMDCPEFSIEQIGAEKLGISKQRWFRYLEMMAEAGYIAGISLKKDICDDYSVEPTGTGIHITIQGLEYLSENSVMQKFYSIAKGVAPIIPQIIK